jgi:thioredoxin reductase (NADPH)
MADLRKVIILGSGPAGLTAGIYAGRALLTPLILEGPEPGGQLTTTTEVENFPGFAQGINGPELIQQMRGQAQRFGSELRRGIVSEVALGTRPFSVLVDGQEERAHVVIIAMGATAKTLGLEREKELMGFGLSVCATCDGAFFQGQDIVVIGGGDSACEEALVLTKFGSRVRIILRRDTFRASKIMSQRILSHPKIEVIYSHNLAGLLGDRKTGITGGIIEQSQSKQRTEIKCNAIFYAIGHQPNTSLFRGMLDMNENGYLLTKPNSTKTNIPGVFACGDVQDHVFRQAVTAAGSGCMAAIEAERYLSEQ